MIEMMFDLETLDVKPSAVILSVGAVTFEMYAEDVYAPGALVRHKALNYTIKDRFYRVIDMQEQLEQGRTVSQSTLLWWMQQTPVAREEAFAPVRHDVWQVMNELKDFVENGAVGFEPINKFWASPVSFDFGIWNDLADGVCHSVPWTYRQVFDVRTVLNEASYSAKDHVNLKEIAGQKHMPVTDCEVQIDELVQARNKIGRRIASS